MYEILSSVFFVISGAALMLCVLLWIGLAAERREPPELDELTRNIADLFGQLHRGELDEVVVHIEWNCESDWSEQREFSDAITDIIHNGYRSKYGKSLIHAEDGDEITFFQGGIILS